MTITYRVHALQRMFHRGISRDAVRRVLEAQDVIEDYPADHPYPSRQLLGREGTRPLRFVAAYNGADDETIVITAYEPDLARWSAGFRPRRP